MSLVVPKIYASTAIEAFSWNVHIVFCGTEVEETVIANNAIASHFSTANFKTRKTASKGVLCGILAKLTRNSTFNDASYRDWVAPRYRLKHHVACRVAKSFCQSFSQPSTS